VSDFDKTLISVVMAERTDYTSLIIAIRTSYLTFSIKIPPLTVMVKFCTENKAYDLLSQ